MGGASTSSYMVNRNRSQALQKKLAQEHSLKAAANTQGTPYYRLGGSTLGTHTSSSSNDSALPANAYDTMSYPSPSQNYRTYTNSLGDQIESPDSNAVGATAICVDGTYSHSVSSSGTCSSHGGVYSAPTFPAATATVAVSCDAPTQQMYVSSYNSSLNSENSYYQSQLDQIQLQYSQQLGGSMSGLINNSNSQASDQHQQNLSSLLSALNSKLIAINCPTQ